MAAALRLIGFASMGKLGLGAIPYSMGKLGLGAIPYSTHQDGEALDMDA